MNKRIDRIPVGSYIVQTHAHHCNSVYFHQECSHHYSYKYKNQQCCYNHDRIHVGLNHTHQCLFNNRNLTGQIRAVHDSKLNIPLHDLPSKLIIYPTWQLHKYEPFVFSHTSVQLWKSKMHSSTSVIKVTCLSDSFNKMYGQLILPSH